MTWDEAQPIVDSIEGYLIEGQAEWLFNKSKSLPEGARILELGTHKGKSTAALAAGLSNVDSVLLTTVDQTDWGVKYRFKDWPDLYFITDFQIDTTLDHLWGQLENKFDLVFIDASHRFTNVLVDFTLSYRALKQGGWLVLHDYDPEFPDVCYVWDRLGGILGNHEACASIRAGQKVMKEHETP